MGRELRRKQAKKEGKSLQREEIEEKNQIKKLIKITCLLIFIVCLIYILSALFITKELKWFGLNEVKEETTTTTIHNTIVASSIFKQKEESYYVYFYDFNDDKNQNISQKVSSITDFKVYNVDTSSGLNSKYVDEVGNREATSLDNLKVVSPTLIKIVASEIKEYYEGNEILNIK